MIEFIQGLNWVIVGQIILIDILLGGDNAIVIALACRQDDAPSGRELANHMMAVVEGGIVMAKAHGEPKRIAGAIHEFKRYLKALIK